MPFVDLFSSDDYASIFYRTSSPYGNVSGFDADKPTILILHPMFLDTAWLDCQFGDPRLYMHYNLIAFDMRSVGGSTCRPSGRHDSWVDAADIALCHQKLHLPPCHVFALEGLAVFCALRFALLFPEMCLSLALCNVPAPTEPKWTGSSITEFMHAWCYAEDLERLEHAATESIRFFFGPNLDVDLKDELVAHLQKTRPPVKRPWTAETISVLVNRTPLDAEAYAEITQPVLILHGERSELCARKYSETLAAQLTNAKDGAVIYTVRGAGAFLSIIPGSASIVNQTLTKFLSRVPRSRSDIVPPETSILDRMTQALDRQAKLIGKKNPSISLDPLSSLSFSCVSKQIADAQSDMIAEYTVDRLNAFNPLGPDGRPLRKMSLNRDDHWFEISKGGISVADTTKFLPNESSNTKKELEKTTRAGDAPQQLIKPSSLTSAAMEKYIIKGPMAKVIREPSLGPPGMGRMLT